MVLPLTHSLKDYRKRRQMGGKGNEIVDSRRKIWAEMHAQLNTCLREKYCPHSAFHGLWKNSFSLTHVAISPSCQRPVF